MPDSAPPPVLIGVENHLGHITLNRPRRINALTHDMIRSVRRALAGWVSDPQVRVVLIEGAGEPGLCAGADIRSLREEVLRGFGSALSFLSDEYRMNSTLGHYPKPVVAFMSGITFGGGLGISGHCSTRIVTETSQLAMPETAIGLCPDVGGLHLLSRAPGGLGVHGALAGARFGPADALAIGLADRFVPAIELPALADELRSGLIPPLADTALEPGELARQREWIDPCYSLDTVESIIGALRARPEPPARAAADTLTKMAPTALKVTLEAIRRAATMTLDQVLDQDLRVSGRFLTHPDLAEGIRAMIVDKDRQPRWKPDRLELVDAADVDAFFGPLPAVPDVR